MPRKVRRTSLARFLLETQEERVRAYATAIGTCDEVVIDAGESAKTLKRPGLQRVLADVRCGTITTVIVVKLDRLTRSVRDLGEIVDLFERTGAALISVSEYLDTSSASGRLMMNLL
ncbi:MAG: recombinase family protein, partial [Vulcanimicrobiaceae bacterium]